MHDQLVASTALNLDGLLVRIEFVQHIDSKHLVGWFEGLVSLMEASCLRAERPFCDFLGVCVGCGWSIGIVTCCIQRLPFGFLRQRCGLVMDVHGMN